MKLDHLKPDKDKKDVNKNKDILYEQYEEYLNFRFFKPSPNLNNNNTTIATFLQDLFGE